MQPMHGKRIRPKSFKISASAQVIVNPVMAIFSYGGELIALLNEKGLVVWRDERFPLYLVEYIIEHPTPQSRWN